MSRLSDIKTGCVARIIFIDGGRGAQHRLAELGLLPGERIAMLHNSGAGPITISVKGSKLSLGQGLANKIIVREQ